MSLIYFLICISLSELISFSGSIYFVLLYWNKAEERLRILTLFCGFAMLFLLEKDSKADKHFLWEIEGSVGDVLSRFWISCSLSWHHLVNWFCSSGWWHVTGKIMALSMKQVRRKCYRVGEKHVVNQFFSLILFLTFLLPLHKPTNEEPTNCSLTF